MPRSNYEYSRIQELLDAKRNPNYDVPCVHDCEQCETARRNGSMNQRMTLGEHLSELESAMTTPTNDCETLKHRYGV